MKKMYKKPITEKIDVNINDIMQTNPLSQGGNTSEIGGGDPEGSAPKRRDVF